MHYHQYGDNMNLHQSTGGDKNMQEKLLILRNRHNLNKKEMAKRLDISSRTYNLKERGVYEFTSDEMFIIKDLFGGSIEDIFLPRNHHNGDI